MSTLSKIFSTTSAIALWAALGGFSMVMRSTMSTIREMEHMIKHYIPENIRRKITFKLFGLLFRNQNSEITLVIDEFKGLSHNEVYEAVNLYLKEMISATSDKLKVSKTQGEKDMAVTMYKGEEITDFYRGMELKWVMVCTESRNRESEVKQKYSYHLRFSKSLKEVVLVSYLPYILELLVKSRKEPNRVVKIQSLAGGSNRYLNGALINLNHPSTFDTLAMDPIVKKTLMDDLDKFVKRKDYYRRIGKAWKRGYLLYGPPGTGKSSLVAAIANYLKFNVYDLELTSVNGDMNLRNLLVSTRNQSIIVIEDIDCTINLNNRTTDDGKGEAKVTLSGLLNFIDGLWSSCGDEKIIIFTTNYKDKLDPALLRPGRMDMHVHMSYLAPSSFRVLAFNYLAIKDHPLFTQIDRLLQELEITPAIVAEELMKCDNDDPDATLQSLILFLKNERVQLTLKRNLRKKCQRLA